MTRPIDWKTVTREEFEQLMKYLDDVLEWYSRNEVVPSLDPKLKVLWRQRNRLGGTQT